MLESDELAAVASAYGVADGQVRRDHLISHVLLRITGATVAPYEFRALPSSLDWEAQLAHQTRTLPSAQECLDTVRAA
jgi:hypothetical protein